MKPDIKSPFDFSANDKGRLQQIKPNYSFIKQYLKDPSVMEGYFNRHFAYRVNTNRKNFEDLQKLINIHAQGDDNLYFFWVWYCENAEMGKWFKDIKLFQIRNCYNKDLTELKKLFEIWDAEYTYNHNENYVLDSISFNLTGIKKSPLKETVNSHLLISEIFTHLKDWVASVQLLDKPKEKNVKTYFNNLIFTTKPLFNYLKDTHFKGNSNNNVYDFIADFLITLGVAENRAKLLLIEQIKMVYKKRGKTTL